MINKRLSACFSAVILLAGCATTPYTNRKQLMMVSEDQENQMGLQAYDEVVKKSKISTDPAATAMLSRVGSRIAAVAEKPDYKWQFTLIDEPKTVNAFCLPGGRVAVYTGLLPITKDENGLAVVLSHEVAHAIARHGGERISDQMAAGLALDVALGGKSEARQYLVAQAYGIGVVLPFSR
jgi:predicted Zn-dependent protease